MYLRTQWIQLTFDGVDGMLVNLVDATPVPELDIDSTIRLYTDGPAPAVGVVLGDYTEPTFTGYTPFTLTAVVGPVNLPNGRGMTANMNFKATAAVSPAQLVKGMLIVLGDGTTLWGVEQFAQQVPFSLINDNLNYDLILAPKSRWGGEAGA